MAGKKHKKPHGEEHKGEFLERPEVTPWEVLGSEYLIELYSTLVALIASRLHAIRQALDVPDPSEPEIREIVSGLITTIQRRIDLEIEDLLKKYEFRLRSTYADQKQSGQKAVSKRTASRPGEGKSPPPFTKSKQAIYREELADRLGVDEGGLELLAQHGKIHVLEDEAAESTTLSEAMSLEQLRQLPDALIDPDIFREIRSVVVQELQENWRIPQPTRYEQMLDLFEAAGMVGVFLDDLAALYDGSTNAWNSARTAIGKLNDKYLNPHGAHIGRSPTQPDIYRIYSITPKAN